MRVAYVCSDPGVPVWGSKGASVHVQEVVRALRRRGAAVELLCARTGGEPPRDLADVPVHRLPGAPPGDLAARERACVQADRALAAALAVLGPVDLIYERYSLFGRAGMAHAARLGVPGVLELNAPLIEEQARHRGLAHRHAAEAVVRGALGDATVAVAVSDPVATWARERARTPERVHVVANGVDVERIRPVRRQHDGPGALRVGFLGTLKPWHGTETLVDAMGHLAAHEGDGWELLLVGDGPQAESLHDRAQGLLIADRVEFTGAVAPSAVPAQLARMDVAVAPYPSDDGGYCSPLKLFEYLAAGLPIVASHTRAVIDVLHDGHNSVLVPPDDPAALAAALATLRRDPRRRAALARAARDSAVRHHNWQRTVERILALAFAAGPPAEAA